MHFDDFPYRRPSLEELQLASQSILDAWDQAKTPTERVELIERWDKQQMAYETQKAIAEVHFAQNTADAAIKEEKSWFDGIDPDVKAMNLKLLRRVADASDQGDIEIKFGKHALNLWNLQLQTFEPSIADHKRRESELRNAYDELRASIRVEFEGETLTLSRLRAFFGDPDRARRRAALQTQDEALMAHQAKFDAIFDELTTLRHDMALAMGDATFTPLGYRRLLRTDYGPEQVETFRAQVREVVLPLIAKIHARRANDLGVETFGFEDEWVRDKRGAPKPKGDGAFLKAQAQTMFDALGEDFGAFFALMERDGLMDLESREGKVSGGFCEAFAAFEVPFIFANFNGTQHDVEVFTHECGHAFQYYCSRSLTPRDCQWPTLEACEIHSMGLEMLAYPYMELFFGEDAERFKMGHMEDNVLFLAYGVAVDHFQHMVYERPEATAEERASMWKEVEAMYLPHRTYTDMPFFGSGRYWQRQGHIFHSPFYYIDYCLASVCALQLWYRAEQDRDEAMALYRRLCTLGGTLPFTALLEEVGLDSPLEPGTLGPAIAHLARAIGLD